MNIHNRTICNIRNILSTFVIVFKLTSLLADWDSDCGGKVQIEEIYDFYKKKSRKKCSKFLPKSTLYYLISHFYLSLCHKEPAKGKKCP